MGDQLLKDLNNEAPMSDDSFMIIKLISELTFLTNCLQRGGPFATAEKYERARILRQRLNHIAMICAVSLHQWEEFDQSKGE